MHRIDGPTRSAALPAPAPAGTDAASPGYFGKGDPATQTPATTLSVDWANAVQEEICGVIEGAGLALDKTSHDQLLAAIQKLSGGGGTTGSGATGRWEKRASGVIDQWGVTPLNFAQGPAVISFPIAFPNACETVILTPLNPRAAQGDNTVLELVSTSLVRANLFVNFPAVGGGGTPNYGFHWRATGN